MENQHYIALIPNLVLGSAESACIPFPREYHVYFIYIGEKPIKNQEKGIVRKNNICIILTLIIYSF